MSGRRFLVVVLAAAVVATGCGLKPGPAARVDGIPISHQELFDELDSQREAGVIGQNAIGTPATVYPTNVVQAVLGELALEKLLVREIPANGGSVPELDGPVRERVAELIVVMGRTLAGDDGISDEQAGFEYDQWAQVVITDIVNAGEFQPLRRYQAN